MALGQPSPSDSSNHDQEARLRVGPIGLGMAIAFGLTFLLRWLTVDFTNDQFTHLSRARQIVLGEWPIRDFFDPGQFLHYYVSAAALVVFGYNLFGEALVTIGFIALGAALTFGLASRWSRSRAIGAGATVLAVAALPRLYNYPKVFLYVAALWLVSWYAERPSRLRTGALAAFTMLAFLFRYDHGAYIAGLMVLVLTLVHADRPRQAVTNVATYSVLFCLLLMPFAIYVQWAEGLQRYVIANQSPVTLVAKGAGGGGRIRLQVDSSLPLLLVHPFAERRVTIRWKTEVTDSSRRELESRYKLIDPVLIDTHTWRYGLNDLHVEDVSALLNDKMIVGVEGLDANSDEWAVIQKLWHALDRYVPIFRISIAPGFFTANNAYAFFYYLTVGLPPLVLLVSVVAWWRGTIAKPEAAAVAAAACALLVIHLFLLAAPEHRLPDVVSSTVVLGAWVAGRWLGRSSPPGSQPRWAAFRRASLLVVFGVTLWSVATYADTTRTVQASQLMNGPVATWKQLTAVYHDLHRRPIDTWAPEGENVGIRALGRYILRCTNPDDRLFVAGDFAPEIFFYSERAFAAGHVHFMSNWHGSHADQRLAIARLRRESVPIALIGRRGEVGFNRFFPDVAEYVRTQYVEVANSSFNDDSFWRVLVDPRREPLGTDVELGLPCYRHPPAEE